jgi:hypothetical protein
MPAFFHTIDEVIEAPPHVITRFTLRGTHAAPFMAFRRRALARDGRRREYRDLHADGTGATRAKRARHKNAPNVETNMTGVGVPSGLLRSRRQSGFSRALSPRSCSGF